MTAAVEPHHPNPGELETGHASHLCQFHLAQLGPSPLAVDVSLTLDAAPQHVCSQASLMEIQGLSVAPISNMMEKQSQRHHQRGPTAVSAHFVIPGHPSHSLRFLS